MNSAQKQMGHLITIEGSDYVVLLLRCVVYALPDLGPVQYEVGVTK